MPEVMDLINEAGSAHRVIVEQSRKLAGKWQRSGLLEGLEGNEKHAMAVMLENQAGQLLSEASVTNPQGAGSAGENWAGVALPLVRKVMGSIASKNFVSVQPMNLPAGLVFFMDFKFGNSVAGKVAGRSIYGNTGSATYGGFENTSQGGLYGAGAFGYTINDQLVSINAVAAATGSVTFADVNYNSDYVATGSLIKVVIPAVSASNGDFLAARAFLPSGSLITSDAVLPEFTKYDGTNLTFILNGATVTAVTASGLFFVQQPTDTTRGDFEDRTGGPVDADTDLAIPQIDLELRSETIVARTRKLKAVWTPELAQDLNAYHSVDAEAELTSMLSDFISTEIDLEILDMLIKAAPTIEYWNAEIGKIWNGATFVTQDFTGTAWTNGTWFQTLGQKMQKVSNRIHQLTMRGGANFAVTSPTVATILETIPGFMAATDGDKMEFAGGVTKVGSFANRYTIYKNPYMTENVLLLGFRGSNFLETGAVYAPYIPLIMTPLVYDPNNFTPRRGVMTRYAKKIVRPEFFGKIYIGGLQTL